MIRTLNAAHAAAARRVQAMVRYGLLAWLALTAAAAYGFSSFPFVPLNSGATWTYEKQQTGGAGGGTVTRQILRGSADVSGTATKILHFSEGEDDYYSWDGVFGLRVHKIFEPAVPLDECPGDPSSTTVAASLQFNPAITVLEADVQLGRTASGSGQATVVFNGCGLPSVSLPMDYSSAPQVREAAVTPAGTFPDALRVVTVVTIWNPDRTARIFETSQTSWFVSGSAR